MALADLAAFLTDRWLQEKPADHLIRPSSMSVALSELPAALLHRVPSAHESRCDPDADHRHDIPPVFNGLRPLLIGTVHGLAGSAAVALLVLATIRETSWALVYLAIFGIGTIVGMMLVTTLLAAPAMYASARVVRLQTGIRFAAGAVSLVVGVVLAREIVVSNGLFSETSVGSAR